MEHKVMKSPRGTTPRRGRVPAPSAEQYSLFAATPRSPDEDARHFERQAQLCQRLLSGLHQPELVELLGRLHEEFEAKAGNADTAGGTAAPRGAAAEMADDRPVS